MCDPETPSEVDQVRALRQRSKALLHRSELDRKQLQGAMERRERIVHDRITILHQIIFCAEARRSGFLTVGTVH
jgi:hypothetical protein